VHFSGAASGTASRLQFSLLHFAGSGTAIGSGIGKASRLQFSLLHFAGSGTGRASRLQLSLLHFAGSARGIATATAARIERTNVTFILTYCFNE